MNRARIEKVRALAADVLALSKLVEGEAKHSTGLDLQDGRYVRVPHDAWKANDHLAGSKHTAALRRRSLDLTRALAEMRA